MTRTKLNAAMQVGCCAAPMILSHMQANRQQGKPQHARTLRASRNAKPGHCALRCLSATPLVWSRTQCGMDYKRGFILLQPI